MSVAAELARLRGAGLQASRRSAPPSLLHSAPDAARIPRSETAGAALNALDALSHADPALAGLAPALLLTSPGADRATLEPAAAAELSRAVATVAVRTAPAFALRSVQKLLEWAVCALAAGGRPPAERDALLYAALPFHATPAFVRLVRAVLAAEGSPGAWAWLAPVVRQGKPVTVDFVVAEAPEACLRGALAFSVDGAAAGVLNCPAAALVAAAISRRVAGDGRAGAGADVVSRRRLLLEAVRSVERVRAAVGAEDGARPALVEAGCACLVVLAAGVSTLGVEDAGVREAVMRAAAAVLVQGVDDALCRAAVGAFVASVRVAGGMPRDVFESVANGRVGFCDAVKGVEAALGTDAVEAAVRAYGLQAVQSCVAGGGEGAFAVLRGVLAMDGVGATVVGDLVLGALDGFSGEREGEDATLAAVMLSETIAPLARGRFAAAVDGAVRRHFAGRSKGGRHRVADDALSMALDGTDYAIVKAAVAVRGGTAGGRAARITRGTLVGCLDHPEATVRLAAVRRVAEDEEGGGGEGVAEAVLRRVEIDGDSGVVVAAMGVPRLADICGATGDLVTVVGRRLLQGRDGRKVFVGAMRLLGRIAGERTRVLALVVALSGGKVLPFESSKVRQAVVQLLESVGGDVVAAMLEKGEEGRGEDGQVAGEKEKEGRRGRKKKPATNVEERVEDSGDRQSLALALASSECTAAVAEVLFAVCAWDQGVGLRLISICMRWSAVAPDAEFVRRVLSRAVGAEGGRDAVLASLRRGPAPDDEVLERVWDAAIRDGDAELLEEVLRVLLSRKGGAAEFLQARIRLTVGDGPVVALEMLCGLCIADSAPIATVVAEVVAAVYGDEPRLRRAALGVGLSFCASSTAVEAAGLQQALASVDVKTVQPLVVPAAAAEASMHVLTDACGGRPWAVVTGLLRAYRNLRTGVEQDAALVELVLSRGDAPAACLALVLDRMSSNGRAAEVSAATAQGLVAALGAAEERTEQMLRLLADLAGPRHRGGVAGPKTPPKSRTSPLQSKVVDILLDSGNGGAALLVAVPGLFAAHDCMRILSALASEVPAATGTAKRARRSAAVSPDRSRAAGVAALEVLSRFQASDMPLDLAAAAAPGLWALILNIGRLARKDVDAVTSGMEYQLQLALRVLGVVFCCDRMAFTAGRKGVALHVTPSEVQAAVEAVSYGTAESMHAAIRDAAATLMAALAQHPGASLRAHILPVLEVLVRSPDALASILPPLVAEGLAAAEFVPQVTAAAVGDKLRYAAVACAVRACPDRVGALALAIDVVASDPSAASAVIVRCDLPVAEQLSAVAKTVRGSLAALVTEHLTSAAFLSSLDNAAAGGNQEAEKAAFVQLFDALVDVSSRGEALGVLLGVMPIHILPHCIRPGTEHALQSLQVLSQGLDASDVFFPSSMQREKAALVHDLSRTLVGILETPAAGEDVKQAAVIALEKLNKSIGYSNRADLLVCAEKVGAMVRSDSSPSLLAASLVLCLASFVETLGASVATLVPGLADASLSMVEAALDGDSDCEGAEGDEGEGKAMVLAEAGIRSCQAILAHLPQFFGRGPLRRIAVLAVKVDFAVLEDLLVQAVTCVKPAAVVGALSCAMDASDDSRGVVLAMKVFARAVDAMRKSDVKTFKPELFAMCVRGLNVGPPREASHALLALVLRLPETEFKPLFHELVERAEPLPLYVAVGTLFDTLRALMLPYFALVLDRTLAILGGGAKPAPGKRARGSSEELVRVALSCTAQFLRHLDGGAAVVERVKDGLLAAFDGGADVKDALAALAARVVSLGPGEESRQLLCSAARGVLLRTRSKDARVRAAACESARCMAVAAGDEFLVALPEAMPVLADLVDDEDEAVEGAARELVRSLEALSGEGILDQLRG